MSEQRASADLERPNYGIRTAAIPDGKIIDTTTFILAVKADVTLDILHTQFVSQTKIGSMDNIRDLINLQLPGIEIKPMPVVPEQFLIMLATPILNSIEGVRSGRHLKTYGNSSPCCW